MVKLKKPNLTYCCLVFVCIMATMGAVIAESVSMPDYQDVDLVMANNQQTRFYDVDGYKYNFFDGGGINAIHISNNTSSDLNYGQVNNVAAVNNAKAGTFYITDTGGRGWQDDGILMIAVNGSDLSGLNVAINASGYQWEPIAIGYPAYSTTTYNGSTLSATFSGSDFTSNTSYNSTWKPAPTANYPFYDQQNVTLDQANGNMFHIIFVDLYAGIIGKNTLSQSDWSGNASNVENRGAIKVDYSISGIPQGSLVAFDNYAYCEYVLDGGVHWTNAVNDPGNNSGDTTSGYYVHNW